MEIEILKPNESVWELGAEIIIGGALAPLAWSITEIGFSAVCEVLPVFISGADSLPPYPGW